MSKAKLNVFGYVRVSTENQLENYSIDEQSERLSAFCKAKDYALLKIYTDGGYSGGNMNRPALQQMLSEIKDSDIDAVIVYKLDRLSRSQKDTLTIIEDEFLKNSIDFISINENFDTSTPFGRAMIGILSVFAQLEKDQIVERFTMGRIGRCKAGYFHGGANPPFGYDYIDGELKVNEYQALQVQKTFCLLHSGKSLNAVKNEMRQTYGGAWSATRVKNILSNSVYIGKVKFQQQEYEGIHQPLISDETFQSAKLLLNTRSEALHELKPFRASFLLSGLIYCQNCGARYSGNHGYYKCYSRSKSDKKYITDSKCKNKNWEITKLDKIVSQSIRELLRNTELLDGILETESDTPKDFIDEDKIKSRLNELSRQIDKLIELYQVDSIPMEQLKQHIDCLSAEKSNLEKMLSDAKIKPCGTQKFTNTLQTFWREFDRAPLDTRRLLVNSLIERVTIDNNTVEVSWRI